MNKQQTKFKYLMGVWKTLPDYPQQEDLKYEISIHLLKEGKINSEFSLQTLKSIFGTEWENTKHWEIFQKMLDSQQILEVNKKGSNKKWFKINK